MLQPQPQRGAINRIGHRPIKRRNESPDKATNLPKPNIPDKNAIYINEYFPISPDHRNNYP
jgi:hypothetical protein